MVEKVNPCEIYSRIDAQYGSMCMDRGSFYAQVKKFTKDSSENGEVDVQLKFQRLYSKKKKHWNDIYAKWPGNS